MSRKDELMNEIMACYQHKKSAYDMQESYSRAAYSSGGSEEARYKALRNEKSREISALEARLQQLGDELLSYGVTWTVHPHNGVVFGRR